MTRKRADQSHPHTPDGRYFVVQSRLWRLANPNLPPDVRKHWVEELMKARRAVRAAGGSARLCAAARAKVDEAKRALGERGPPWWDDDAPDYNRRNVINTPYASWFAAETRSPAPDDHAIEQAIIASLTERDAESSTCPSEIARTLAPGDEQRWRALMPRIREVASKLASARQIRLTRGAVTLAPHKLAAGPIRIRRGPKFSSREYAAQRHDQRSREHEPRIQRKP